MSGREWKPGDVAMVRNEHGVWNLAVCSVKPIGLVWQYGVADSQMPLNAEARPLVVIDPEDWGAVKRLGHAFVAGWGGCDGGVTGAMHTALNCLLVPPKPPEPMGLGAVVETSGGRFVRSDGETCNPWRGPKGVPYEWDDITDSEVRVLSEGVTP